MVKHIVVMTDGETWEELEQRETAAVWTITDEAYEGLMVDGGYPKHLAEEDVLAVIPIRPEQSAVSSA